MRRTALAARLLSATVMTTAAVTLSLAAPSTVVGQRAGDPFATMSVERPPQPVAAPDVIFVTAEGRKVGLGELRGSVVLLGFFSTT